jgi:hypothetical protein
MWCPRIGKRNLGGPKIRGSDVFEKMTGWIAETRCTKPVIVRNIRLSRTDSPDEVFSSYPC